VPQPHRTPSGTRLGFPPAWRDPESETSLERPDSFRRYELLIPRELKRHSAEGGWGETCLPRISSARRSRRRRFPLRLQPGRRLVVDGQRPAPFVHVDHQHPGPIDLLAVYLPLVLGPAIEQDPGGLQRIG